MSKKSGAPSLIPHRITDKVSSNTYQYQSSMKPSNSNNTPLTGGNHSPRYPAPRRCARRCTGSIYQAFPQQQDRPPSSSYLPPQQPSRLSPYCSPRNVNNNNRPIPPQANFDCQNFGPFGAAAQKDDPCGEDIASMFRRSGTQLSPCMLQQQQQHLQQQQFNDAPSSNGMMSAGGAQWQTEIVSGRPVLRSALPSTTQPVVAGAYRSTVDSQRNLGGRGVENVDRILSKYGRTSRGSVRDIEKDPDFTVIAPEAFNNNPEKYCMKDNEFKQDPSVQINNHWDRDQYRSPAKQDPTSPRRRRNIQGKALDDHVPTQGSPDTHSGSNYPQLHTAQQIIADNQTNHQNQNKNPFVFKSSTHVFPFKEAAEGFLVVEPAQIAFESRKLAVLMADPNNNTKIEFSSAKSNGSSLVNVPSNHERILHEVKRAMSILETATDSKPTFHGLSKEINPNYSSSTKATEEFEKRILKRIIAGRNADTHVMIGDKIFPCHSIALEAFSSYFDRLSRPPEYIQKVYLPEADVPSESFPIVMDWIMQSEEERKKIPQKDNLVAVYIAARHLGMKDLESQCSTFLEQKVSSNDPDLMRIWEEVKKRRTSCPELIRIVASKMSASFHIIYENKQYLQMDVDELYMLLCSDDISIESEMEVYSSAVTWLLHDWKTRKVHTNKIMSTVRFGLLTPLQLTQINYGSEITKVKNEKDYNQVLAFGSVKSMIDDGLAYSILDESYKSQPEELKKWVEKSGMKVPPPRTSLLKKSRGERGSPTVITHQKYSRIENVPNESHKALAKSSSYTILSGNQKPEVVETGSGPRFHGTSSSPTAGTNGENYVGKERRGSKSRIPTIASNGGHRPPPPVPPPPATADKGNKRPASYQYQAEPNPVIHELSKPKLLTDSSGMLNQDETETDNGGAYNDKSRPT